MSTATEFSPPLVPAGEKVHLQIPIPALSTHCEEKEIYHFKVIELAFRIREYLATVLSTKSYRLSDDAEYVRGILYFEITSSPRNVQRDFLESQRIYIAASQDVDHALRYLDDPVGAVSAGLEQGRTKSEFHELHKAAAELVEKNEECQIDAAVTHDEEEARVTGTIAPTSAQRQAKRRLNPPTNYQLEDVKVTFVSQDSDGVLVSDEGERFDPGDANRDRYPIGKPVAVEVYVQKTRVSKDVRKITRPLDESEESE